MAVDQEASETDAEHGDPADDAEAAAPDVVDFDALNAALGALPTAPLAGSGPQLADSEGRSSATYSSARPHPIPATRAPAELNAPAVIIAPDEPLAAMKMTANMPPVVLPQRAAPAVTPYQTEPYVAVAQPHPPPPPENAGRTMPLAAAQRPRRPRTPTVVVRARGPSRLKKVLVFVLLLLLFVVGGAAFLFVKSPGLLPANLRALTGQPAKGPAKP